ncbi:hypothetical protein BM526_19010 (plasmid) [Alteromonas mediterranea]|nr:hypothetical protein BM526_19010 [Alteromonas mediterranea]
MLIDYNAIAVGLLIANKQKNMLVPVSLRRAFFCLIKTLHITYKLCIAYCIVIIIWLEAMVWFHSEGKAKGAHP